MKYFLGFLILSFVFSACDFNKYTKVRIKNDNPYPLEVKIVTANIESVHKVPAGEFKEELRKFTDIDRQDGKWVVTLTNANTGQGKTYEHGNFIKGELANFFTIQNKGSYVSFSVDN